MPGFDGLRVPARYGMLVMVFLSVTAGFGALVLERRSRLLVILIGLFVESIIFRAIEARTVNLWGMQR